MDLKEYMIASSMFSAVMDSATSEQSARMAAMENASKNAGELIEALTLQYNKARQTRITTELIEIISGEEKICGLGIKLNLIGSKWRGLVELVGGVVLGASCSSLASPFLIKHISTTIRSCQAPRLSSKLETRVPGESSSGAGRSIGLSRKTPPPPPAAPHGEKKRLRWGFPVYFW